MKKVFQITLCFLFSWALQGQAPAKFQYQGVARDAGGNVITGWVELRLSMLQGSALGPNVYAEVHEVQTDPQGIFSLIFNDGVPVSGDIYNIEWAKHLYWLKVEYKPAGSAQWIHLGTTQLLSVPYALYAVKSGSSLTAGEGISIANDVISNSGDISTSNELQTLHLDGDQLSISDGNSIILPAGTAYVAGAGININGNTISAIDMSPTNEMQTLSVNGNQLSISNGNAVNLPVAGYQGGAGIQINGNIINATDASTTNEIQTLSLNGGQLSLSNNGGSVQLPAGATSWTIQNGDEITSAPATNSVVIGGSGSANSRLYVGALGADHAGNFFSPASGNAVHAYSNGTGYGVFASSLQGIGGYFSSNASHALITGSGNVGIGTATPDYKLTVAGTLRGAPSTGNALRLYSPDAPVIRLEQGEYEKGIEYRYGNSRWTTSFGTSNDFDFQYGATVKAWINETDGAYQNSSDRSLKKDIRAFTRVLPNLTKLQAYTYRMLDAPDDSPLSVGFMAQEVEAQFPGLVSEKNGYKSICYDHFAVLSVEAIKEQQVEIDELKQQLEELKVLLTEAQGK
jgi:hypothetical protein